LALDFGLGHVTADTNSLRYNMPDEEFYHLMKSLNFEQLQFVYDTIHHLKTSSAAVHRFLSGGAGTGKSYVLKALREMAERFYKSRSGENYEQNFTMTLAPTGKAAFIAAGATIHSVLHIPANQSLTYTRLDCESLNTLCLQIGHIKLSLIDEISMVGHRMLSFIDQRLQEVHNNRLPFGGTSVIAFGDLYQLPPVMDGFVFADLSSSPSHVTHYNALAPNLWKENFTMFELTAIMRQQDSCPFAELLARVHEGNQLPQDLNTLHSRTIAPDAANYPSSAQHVFKTKNQVETHNISLFERSTEQKYLIKSIDSVVGNNISEDMASHILNIIPSDSRKTAQLPSTLLLAVGCRYEISVNVNVSDGLANSAGGIIQHIQLTTDNLTASGIVWMLFDDNKVGARTRADSRTLCKSHIHHTWTPILPLSRQFQVGRSHSAQVLRKQFPLRQSAAKTIHRSQGDTMDQVVVDFTSSCKEPHIHYVGLSRVRTLEGLFILNLCENKMHISENVRHEMAQLCTSRRMPISLYFPQLHASPTTFNILFLNVRSLHKHIAEVRHDHVITACDVCIFCETRTADTDDDDMYHIDNFNHIIHCSSHNSRQRPHYGLALYSKLPVIHRSQPVTLATSNDTDECSVIRIALQPSVILSIACVYRRPSTDLEHLKYAISHITAEIDSFQCTTDNMQHHVLIMGDFNLDWCEQSTRDTMTELLPRYTQLVSDVTTDYSSTLDHVYTTMSSQIAQCYVTESYFSDHKLVIAAIHF